MLKRLRARRAHARGLAALTAALEAHDWPRAERLAREIVMQGEGRLEESALIGPRYALASALLAQGALEEAEAASRRAIEAAKAAPAKSDPPLPQLLEQLAAILDRRGDHGALEQLFREMVASYDRMRAPDPGEQATALERLALLLARNDRREEAAPLFARAIAVHENGLGTDPALSQRLYNAASFHPDPAAAILLFERARACCEDRALAARVDHNLAAALETAGRNEEARAAYQRALVAFEELGEAQRPTLVRLARLEHAAGAFATAAALYERALNAARSELGPDDAIVARIALWLGDARSEIFR